MLRDLSEIDLSGIDFFSSIKEFDNFELKPEIKSPLSTLFESKGYESFFRTNSTFLSKHQDNRVFPNVYYYFAVLVKDIAFQILLYDKVIDNIRTSIPKEFFQSLGALASDYTFTSLKEFDDFLNEKKVEKSKEFIKLVTEGVENEGHKGDELKVINLIFNSSKRLNTKEIIDSKNYKLRSDFLNACLQKLFPINYNSHGNNLPVLIEILLSDLDVYNALLTSIILTKASDESLSAIMLPKAVSKSGIIKNRIIYGAPGTGKSNKLKSEIIGEVIRVTFNPEITYGQFVGTYKPVSVSDGGKTSIEYNLVPGAFLNALVKAKHTEEPVCLIIEEINRANVSAVFGDVFQLLDRTDTGDSEYPICFNREIMSYLVKEKVVSDVEEKVVIPSNLYLWATMNSADQGVFPMDSAFKRRWSFEYIGINENENKVIDYIIKINDVVSFKWNVLRTEINNFLIGKKIQEDKLLGPFFLSEKELNSGGAFEGKLALYLWDDVLRHKNRSDLFKPHSLSKIHELTKSSKNKKEFLSEVFSDDFLKSSKLDESES